MRRYRRVTYSKAIKFLYSLQLFGTKFGLENTLKLAALAGNPQQKLRFIHVAGTNGKGSTCAMLESIYRAAGLRVGLFTSPHLVSFRERIQINRELIKKKNVTQLVVELQILLRHFTAKQHPTFFEVVTVMALKYFTEKNCDLVIWETGLGGRLDATNIVMPLASVITNIQFDHEKWLGDSLEKIAFEKAGIIKPGIPVITAVESNEALKVIRHTAKKYIAPLTIISPNSKLKTQNLKLSLLGDHQKTNAASAMATVRILNSQIPVSKKIITEGLSRVHWPGRFQVIQKYSQRILLDGAHNPASAQTVRTTLAKYFPTEKITLILGILRDKNFGAMSRILAPLAEKILLVPVSNARTLLPKEWKGACQKINPAAKIIPCETLADALQQSASDPFLVITGSLYLIGEAMELLKISSGKKPAERGLNEWNDIPLFSKEKCVVRG
ncbi:MAG: bifunctional folylpolyglutamate synthase/dihydrofolate synthase [Verrucomicrobiota bacterium]|nr:bifunctional folylpolyglutamate synthase/dihydrofolate synthase [Verrucomicrobiota bacterium]